MVRCTIITPCYDDGEHLGELRRSLSAGEPVDHIIVDDGSTDPGTLAVLDQLAQEPGVTVIHVANGGPAAARNLAVRAVTTPYAMPVDADDLVLPGAVRDLADALDADPGLAVVWGDSLSFGAELAHHPRAVDLDPWWFTFLNEMAVGLMGRSEILAEAGWDETSGYEDWGTTLALIEQGERGRNIGRATYGYRQHEVPRRLATAHERDEDEIGNLRSRYSAAFSDRSRARRRSSAPWSVRLIGTLVAATPGLSRSAEHRWVNRLSAYVWRRRWIHHPSELPRNPLSRRLPGGGSRPVTGRFALDVASAIPGATDVAIVSPHPDDAVLSAFALLDDPAITAHVANVFTRPTGADDWAKRTGTGDARHEAEVRESEDRAAVGDRADVVDLACDAEFSDDRLLEAITSVLDEWHQASSGQFVVAAPAGAGLTDPAPRRAHVGPVARVLGSATSERHPDHVRVRDAVVAWGRANPAATVVLYDELPYHWACSGIADADPARVFHLPIDAGEKAAAVRHYESQLDSLFTEEQIRRLERFLPAVESFAVVGD